MGKNVKNTVGRPRATDKKDVVSLLVTSFHSGLTVREACWQSGISHDAYYNRLRSDKLFADTMAKAQSDITMTAKKLIAKEIRSGSVSAARWWLERNSTKEAEQPETIEDEAWDEDDVKMLENYVKTLKQLEQQHSTH